MRATARFLRMARILASSIAVRSKGGLSSMTWASRFWKHWTASGSLVKSECGYVWLAWRMGEQGATAGRPETCGAERWQASMDEVWPKKPLTRVFQVEGILDNEGAASRKGMYALVRDGRHDWCWTQRYCRRS